MLANQLPADKIRGMPGSFSLCLVILAVTSATVGCRAPILAKASSLIEADLAFARSGAARGTAAAFRDYAAPEAVVFPQGAKPVVGRENIFHLLGGDSGVLTWRPRGADISRGGDLGYTWGEYEYRPGATNAAGPIHYGKYLTVWKKQKDGSWKFVADIGNPSPAP
jgi:ketosteroid isomerase-like protein